MARKSTSVNKRASGRKQSRAWLRLDILESRVTPTVLYPDLPHTTPATTFLPWPSSLFDVFNPPVDSKLVPTEGAPIFSEWTRTAGPDQSIAITGHSLSSFQGVDAGKDTQFFAYGQTIKASKDDEGDATLRNADLLRLDGPRAALTLSSKFSKMKSDSMYLLWPQNAEGGVGQPVSINETEVWWMSPGPEAAIPGEMVSVYGRNLAHQGTSNSWVYIEAITTSQLSQRWIPITNANPYRIDFTLPSQVESGEEYNIFVHNGHGSTYGFSEPLKIKTRNSLVTSTKTFDVTHPDYGATGNDSTDDLAAINKAIAAAHDYAITKAIPDTAATVYFPAGTYYLSAPLINNMTAEGLKNITYLGDIDSKTKEPTSFILPHGGPNYPPAYPTYLFYAPSGGGDNLQFRNLEFDGAGVLVNSTPTSPLNPRLVVVRGGKDIVFENVHFEANYLSPSGFDNVPLDVEGSHRVTINECKFVTAGPLDIFGATQVRIDDCHFYGGHGVFVAFGLRYSSHIIPPNPIPPAIAQIVIGADAGGGPHVRVFDAVDGAITKEFFAYDASFNGGVRVATHLIDGHPSDIITGAGPGGGPHVKVFSGNDRAELQSFFAYDPGFYGGVYVASSGNNIVTTPGSTGGPHVRVFDSSSKITQEFFAYDPGFRSGIRVGVVADLDGDSVNDIVTTPGPGGGPDVRYFSGATRMLINEYFANDPSNFGGVFVAARQPQ